VDDGRRRRMVVEVESSVALIVIVVDKDVGREEEGEGSVVVVVVVAVVVALEKEDKVLMELKERGEEDKSGIGGAKLDVRVLERCRTGIIDDSNQHINKHKLYDRERKRTC